MSVEDVEIVRRWREVLVEDDTEAAAPLLAPDVEWVVVSGESLRGIEEVRKYYAGSGSGGPENLDVEFAPGELEDRRVAFSVRLLRASGEGTSRRLIRLH